MSFMETLTQKISIADVINSQSVNNATVTSIGINVANFKRVMYVIQAASLGAAGTLTGYLQSCFESNFASNVHNIANTNLTTINTSTTPGNNALATIEVRVDQVNQQNQGDQYVRLALVGGGNAITVGAIGLGADSPHKPDYLLGGDLSNTYLSQRVVVTP
jgi:hypothetical protein